MSDLQHDKSRNDQSQGQAHYSATDPSRQEPSPALLRCGSQGLLLAALIALPWQLLACGSEDAVPSSLPAGILIHKGDHQRAASGSKVPTPPSVKVIDADGEGIEGVLVSFYVGVGDGSISPEQVKTDQKGDCWPERVVLGGRGREHGHRRDRKRGFGGIQGAGAGLPQLGPG